MARLRFSSLDGALDTAVSSSDVTLSSPEFANLPVVASPDYLVLILDPGELAGDPEIVYVYAHLAAATSVSVIRGSEQAHGAPAGRDHAAGTIWHHGPTPGEFIDDIEGGAHTVAATPIPLKARVVTRELSADIEAFTDFGELAVIDLVLACDSGTPAWTSHTGILITWAAGSAPTLTTTPGNFDVIRLTRMVAGGPIFLAEHVVVDATFALV